MSRLYDVTPNALAGGGIFSVLDSSAYEVPWADDVIALQLDMEYYGNFSGDKITSPLVDKLLEGGELTTAGMAQLAQVVYSLNFRRWVKEWQTQLAEYDPISNYDMTEEMSEEGSTQYGHTRLRTDNLAHTETRTDNLQHVVDASEVETPAVTTTEQDSVRAFNSSSDQPSNKRTQSASGTNRKDNDVTERDTGTQAITGNDTGTQSDAEGGEDANAREYTLTRRGNIGVTTSQQMLESERTLWMWNYFFEVVFPDVDKILTSPIYMTDAAGTAAGGSTPEGEISINRNGIYNVSRYASALVNVPNSYGAEDEGKVVNNGELVAQTQAFISDNGTFDTLLNNIVSVNVPNSYSAEDEGKVVNNGELVAQTQDSISDNGSYDTTLIDRVYVDVRGGVMYEWQFADKDGVPGSLIDKIHNVAFRAGNAVLDPNGGGLLLNGANIYATLPIVPIPYMTIELELGNMTLQGTGHKRMVMYKSDSGLIYRDNGKWSFYYGNGWATDSNITDFDFFANKIMSIYIDESWKWHILRDDLVCYEPDRPQATLINLGEAAITLGASSSSAYQVLIKSLKVKM